MMTASLLLVIPCYNEAQRLPLEKYHAFFQQHPYVDFCFVDDGSQDETKQILEKIAKEFSQVSVVNLAENQGKSGAVRAGILSALAKNHYQLVGYWDADLAHPLKAIPDFLKVFATYPHYSFVIGSRVQLLGRDIPRHRFRQVLGKIFAVCARIALNLQVYDPQCGAKIMRCELANQVFQQPFISRWLFDLEIMARMIQSLGRQQTINQIYEVALREWQDHGASKLRLADMLRLPLDFMQILLHYRCHQFYLPGSSIPQ